MTRFYRTLSGVLLLLAGLAALAGRAEAGWSGGVATTTGSGIDAQISSPIERCPRHGSLPVWVTIKNRSGAARTWTVRTEDRALYSAGGGNDDTVAVQSFRVENEQTARLPLLVPLQPAARDTRHYRTVNIQLSGYGIEPSTVNFPTGGISGRMESVFIGMSSTLATPIWASLEQAYKDHAAELIGSPLDLTLLGPDWRGLSGFDCLWLTDADYAGLDAARRTALRHWLDQGGTLFLCAESLPPALRAGLALPPEGTEGRPGAGFVKLIPWDGKTLPLDVVKSNNDHTDSPHEGRSVTDATGWPMTQSVGVIPLNSTFLILFISLFAVVAGPVNVFWLAGSTRRHRLFWTTPLISCAASVLLVLVIVLQDGFGGYGERTLVTLLLPAQREAVVVQEQVVRTGVLLSRHFEASEDLLLSPLKVTAGARRSFEQSGRAYAGDWFTSRSVQALRAEAIVPSRAEVQLLNAEAANAGAPPVVVSSVPATLAELGYVDLAGHRWHGHNLHTGERVTLQPGSATPPSAATNGSALLSKYEENVRQTPGYFCAYTDEGPFIDTLSSIRWQRQCAVYLGPVTPLR